MPPTPKNVPPRLQPMMNTSTAYNNHTVIFIINTMIICWRSHSLPLCHSPPTLPWNFFIPRARSFASKKLPGKLGKQKQFEALTRCQSHFWGVFCLGRTRTAASPKNNLLVVCIAPITCCPLQVGYGLIGMGG